MFKLFIGCMLLFSPCFQSVNGFKSQIDINKDANVTSTECDYPENCFDCLTLNNCAWSTVENRCVKKWIYNNTIIKNSNFCNKILEVIPNEVQITAQRSLTVIGFFAQYVNKSKLNCSFSWGNQTLLTEARYNKGQHSMECETPEPDLMPKVPHDKTYITVNLSIKEVETEIGSNAIEIVFFDCNAFKSCVTCVKSKFACDWCISNHICSHYTKRNCNNDFLVLESNKIGPQIKIGSNYCPGVKSLSEGSNVLLIPSGTQSFVSFKVQLQGYVDDAALVCEFIIDGVIEQVKATLNEDTVVCANIDFSFNSKDPIMNIPFFVKWQDLPLDNLKNTTIVVYSCANMADDCDSCLGLPSKYKCGWCQDNDTCEVKEKCESPSVWLKDIRINFDNK